MPQMFCMPTLILRRSLYALHEKYQTSSEVRTVNDVPVKDLPYIVRHYCNALPRERLHRKTFQNVHSPK